MQWILQEKRKALLEMFYTSFDKETLNSILADDVKIIQDDEVQPFGKKGDARCSAGYLAGRDESWRRLKVRLLCRLG